MENLTGGTPPVRYLLCVVPCKLYFVVNVKTVPGRYTSSSGHFMVVHGSFIDMAYPDSSVYFTYTDPHYNDNYYGTFTLSGASMYDAIDSNAGNYVRVA